METAGRNLGQGEVAAAWPTSLPNLTDHEAIAPDFLSFVTVQGGIVAVESSRITWAHKTYEEYLAAVALESRLKRVAADLLETVALWRAGRARSIMIFLLGLLAEKEGGPLLTAVDDMLRARDGVIFLSEAAVWGVGLPADVKASVALELRMAVIEEFRRDPRTMCEKTLSFADSREFLEALMSARQDQIFRTEIVILLADESAPLLLRQDILRQIAVEGEEEIYKHELLGRRGGVRIWRELNSTGELFARNEAAVRSAKRFWPWSTVFR
jgi:hypothetical protein